MLVLVTRYYYRIIYSYRASSPAISVLASTIMVSAAAATLAAVSVITVVAAVSVTTVVAAVSVITVVAALATMVLKKTITVSTEHPELDSTTADPDLTTAVLASTVDRAVAMDSTRTARNSVANKEVNKARDPEMPLLPVRRTSVIQMKYAANCCMNKEKEGFVVG